MKLSEMLRQHLEWLDDEDGTMPFPEFEGETGWVSHDNGSIEGWGQYLLRLSLTEVTQLKEENAKLKGLLGEAMFAHKSGWFDLDLLDRMGDALLTEQEPE